jgi:hypothetical protein
LPHASLVALPPRVTASTDPALEAFWSAERRAWPVALAAGLGAFALYAATSSPLVFTADPAEFQTLARTGGIAHAGYPAYVRLLQLVGAVPLGTLAQRANLLTAAFGAAAIALLAYAARRWNGNRWAALVAAAAFAMSISAWNEATLAGVHAPTLAVDAALLLLALRYRWRPSLALAGAAGLLFGLGLTGHLTVLGLAPPLALALLGGLRRADRPARHVAVAAIALLAGLLPFADTMARDRPEQPMNYLHDTLEPGAMPFAVERPDLGQRLRRLEWLLTGREWLEHDRRDLPRLTYRAWRVASVVFLNDLPFITSLLAGAGLFLLLRGGGAPAVLVGSWFAMAMVLAGLGGVEKTLHYFFLPCTWVLALGLAVALARLAARRRAWAVIAGAFVLATPLVRLSLAEPPGPLSRSHMWADVWGMAPRAWSPFLADRKYDEYGRGVMQRLPPRAVVLGGKWEECTTLRYFVFGEPLRPDVDVLYAGVTAPRFGRLREAAERAGRPVFSTRVLPGELLAGARFEPVWDSGWRELWRVTRDSTAAPGGMSTMPPNAGRRR